MSKIKEAKRSILQIMPADGWVAVLSDNDDDGTLPDTTRAQLFAWAVVREIDGKKACTSPFAPSMSNCLNFKLPVESST